jgi:hypothetical protein
MRAESEPAAGPQARRDSTTLQNVDVNLDLDLNVDGDLDVNLVATFDGTEPFLLLRAW